jgi:hypothetical protein
MLYSALNFAVGFFGLPLEGKYQQSITIEAPGVYQPVFYHIPTTDHAILSSITRLPHMRRKKNAPVFSHSVDFASYLQMPQRGRSFQRASRYLICQTVDIDLFKRCPCEIATTTERLQAEN